jgi:hypothetical protein
MGLLDFQGRNFRSAGCDRFEYPLKSRPLPHWGNGEPITYPNRVAVLAHAGFEELQAQAFR